MPTADIETRTSGGRASDASARRKRARALVSAPEDLPLPGRRPALTDRLAGEVDDRVEPLEAGRVAHRDRRAGADAGRPSRTIRTTSCPPVVRNDAQRRADEPGRPRDRDPELCGRSSRASRGRARDAGGGTRTRARVGPWRTARRACGRRRRSGSRKSIASSSSDVSRQRRGIDGAWRHSRTAHAPADRRTPRLSRKPSCTAIHRRWNGPERSSMVVRSPSRIVPGDRRPGRPATAARAARTPRRARATRTQSRPKPAARLAAHSVRRFMHSCSARGAMPDDLTRRTIAPARLVPRVHR